MKKFARKCLFCLFTGTIEIVLLVTFSGAGHVFMETDGAVSWVALLIAGVPLHLFRRFAVWQHTRSGEVIWDSNIDDPDGCASYQVTLVRSDRP